MVVSLELSIACAHLEISGPDTPGSWPLSPVHNLVCFLPEMTD